MKMDDIPSAIISRISPPTSVIEPRRSEKEVFGNNIFLTRNLQII